MASWTAWPARSTALKRRPKHPCFGGSRFLGYTLFMQIPALKEDTAPQDLREQDVACVWVWLEPRPSATPIQTQAIQHVDWWLQGALSRYLKDPRVKEDQTTFIPTRGRLKAPWVAVECGEEFATERLFQNAAGMKLENVIAVCESPEKAATLKKLLQKEKHQTFPEALTILADEPISSSFGDD